VPLRYDPAADLWRGLDECGTPVVAGESLEGCAAALAAYQRGEPITEDEDAADVLLPEPAARAILAACERARKAVADARADQASWAAAAGACDAVLETIAGHVRYAIGRG
jgi:hypothetical protein